MSVHLIYLFYLDANRKEDTIEQIAESEQLFFPYHITL